MLTTGAIPYLLGGLALFVAINYLVDQDVNAIPDALSDAIDSIFNDTNSIDEPRPPELLPPVGQLRCDTGWTGGGGCERGRVGVDANVLIQAIDYGNPAVDVALNSRSPIASPRAAQQFLVRGSQVALDGWLAARGGGIGSTPDPGRVLALENQAQSMGQAINHTDAEVAASATQDGLSLMTQDQQLFRFLQAAGYPAELW